MPDEACMRQIRGVEIAMIFQDLLALNPVHTVGQQVAEMAGMHDQVGKKEAWSRVVDMLRLSAFPSRTGGLDVHPYEFSGACASGR